MANYKSRESQDFVCDQSRWIEPSPCSTMEGFVLSCFAWAWVLGGLTTTQQARKRFGCDAVNEWRMANGG